MKKAKLALDLLEREMELLGCGEMTGFVGGSGYNPADPGNCIFDMLSYLSESNSIDGYSHSPEYYYDLYASQNNSWDFSYGSEGELLGVNISASTLDTLMSWSLIGTPLSGNLNDSLASGHQVATMITDQGPSGEGHAVIIQCYNGDGTYRVYNPSTGVTSDYSGGALGGTNFLMVIN